MATPCFLLRTDLPSEKLGITSLSLVVVSRLKDDGMCLVLVSEVLNDAYLISCAQLQFAGFGDIFDNRVQIA